jgi:hypothetical protein
MKSGYDVSAVKSTMNPLLASLKAGAPSIAILTIFLIGTKALPSATSRAPFMSEPSMQSALIALLSCLGHLLQNKQIWLVVVYLQCL